jgi:hypothetical protein
VELDLAEGIDKSEEKFGSFAPFLVYYPDEGALPTLPATWRNLFASVVAVRLLEEEIA